MSKPSIAVILHVPALQRCSEEDVFEALFRYCTLDYEEVRVNPKRVPTRLFDLWVSYPFGGLQEPARWLDPPSLRASIAIDITAAYEGFDYHLAAVDPRPPDNPPVARLLNMWQTNWNTGAERPYMPLVLPFRYPYTDQDPEAPRDYAVWNVQAHTDERVQSEVAERAAHVLLDCGIRKLMLLRADRTGVMPTWVEEFDRMNELDFGLQIRGAAISAITVEDGPASAFDEMMAGAFCFMVSAASLAQLSIDKALAYGVPVVGDPSLHRHGEWFTRPEELPLYVGNENLYRLRRESLAMFDEARAHSVLRLARELGAARRRART